MDKNNINLTIHKLVNREFSKEMFESLLPSGFDRYVKKMNTYQFIQLLIFSQLKQSASLARVSKSVKNRKDVQDYLNVDSISTSQLSRKLSNLPSFVLEQALYKIIDKLMKHNVTAFIDEKVGRLKVIDSSTISMSLFGSHWARFRKTKAGVKLHVKICFMGSHVLPEQVILTTAKKADKSQMSELIEYDESCIYLFDRGYNDYTQFEQLCLQNVCFVTRLKKNAVIETYAEQICDSDTIYADKEIFLGSEITNTKMTHPLRLIQTVDSNGKQIFIVTNCFELTANEVGELYRQRWKIETFFKWMKQHLKLRTVYGKSENAVKNQIWIALITYCLQLFLYQKTNYTGSLLEFKRATIDLLFIVYEEFLAKLFYKPKRTSNGRRKLHWQQEFIHIEKLYINGEEDILDDSYQEPLHI